MVDGVFRRGYFSRASLPKTGFRRSLENDGGDLRTRPSACIKDTIHNPRDRVLRQGPISSDGSNRVDPLETRMMSIAIDNTRCESVAALQVA